MVHSKYVTIFSMVETDEEIIHSYKNGETVALKRLIDRYTDHIYNFVRRLGASSDAPDVTQEIFIKVWKNIRKFDESKATFKTWIFTIARNTVTDFLRKKKAILFSDLETKNESTDESVSEKIPDQAILPDEAVQRLQDKEFLNELVETLSPEYRAVLLLYYQEEMTFDAIGKVLNKPTNTVKSQHRRALIALRKMLK